MKPKCPFMRMNLTKINCLFGINVIILITSLFWRLSQRELLLKRSFRHIYFAISKNHKIAEKEQKPFKLIIHQQSKHARKM